PGIRAGAGETSAGHGGGSRAAASNPRKRSDAVPQHGAGAVDRAERALGRARAPSGPGSAITVDGLLVIDKPAGPTSHDVVARLRRVLRERRIGHTGTLDPAATGVLPLVLGRATRLARFLSARDKQYEAVIRLGTATDTYDAQGVATGVRHQGAWPSRREIEAALATFRGTSLQQPPAFSAKKIDGKRSHKLARGQTPLSLWLRFPSIF